MTLESQARRLPYVADLTGTLADDGVSQGVSDRFLDEKPGDKTGHCVDLRMNQVPPDPPKSTGCNGSTQAVRRSSG